MTRTLGVFLFLILTFFIFSATPAFALNRDHKASGPLQTRSQNPLYLQFLHLPFESPQTIKRDHYELSLSTTFSNIFEYDQNGNTTTNIDMELWRTALTASYGLSDWMDVKLELATISNSTGFLDGFVQGYHNAFGFPNGGRDLVSNGSFSYQINQGGRNVINYQSEAMALADSTVRFKIHLNRFWKLPLDVSITPSLKFPTGKRSKGFGSGEFDAGLGLLGQKRLGRFYFTTQLGFSVLGKNNNLANIQKQWLMQFSQHFEFKIWDELSVIAQLQGNTSAFNNNDSDDLNVIVLDFTVGVAGRVKFKKSFFEEFFYQFGFTEDILSKGPSVDFSLLFLSGVRF